MSMLMAVVPLSMSEPWVTIVEPGGHHPALDLRNLWSHGTYFLYWLQGILELNSVCHLKIHRGMPHLKGN